MRVGRKACAGAAAAGLPPLASAGLQAAGEKNAGSSTLNSGRSFRRRWPGRAQDEEVPSRALSSLNGPGLEGLIGRIGQAGARLNT